MIGAKHTPGPWQVVVDEFEHWCGGKHVERRIFTTWSHPQLKAPIGVVNMMVGLGAEKGLPAVKMISIGEADARLISAAPDLLEALQDLHAQVHLFCATYGEADFETGRAAAAIAKATGVSA